jgi:hypothetical protein
MRNLAMKTTCLPLIAAGFMLATATIPAMAQKTFATPELAMKELIEAAKTNQKGLVAEFFGPQGRALVSSGNEAEDRQRLETFNKSAAESSVLEDKDGTTKIVVLGKQAWPFPIPITKKGNVWAFDPVAGKAEIRARLIGHNEMQAIAACRAYIEAQKEYSRLDHDGDRVPEYAQRIISSPGKYDGLYWPADDVSGISPLSHSLADTDKTVRSGQKSYEGYVFRILKRQGPSAPGGAYNYVINGHMIAGHALVAFPLKYGQTGIMTFICGHLGNIYQRDLGPNTAKIAGGMLAYNPDANWTRADE